ncbi:MAG: CehA/McbA family metallohydrolase [Thermoplasmata archaeon]
MNDFSRLDLHVHSKYSPDSRLTLDMIVGRLAYAELKGFALTDHNTVRGHATLLKLQRQHPEYLLLPGVEVSTVEGHLLAYGVGEAPPPHRPILETLDWVRAHGGEAVPAHPFRRTHGVGRAVAQSAPVSAIETRNGHDSEITNLRAEKLAAHRNLGATGGSDAHATKDLGRAYTEFDSAVNSVDDLLESLRKRTTSAEGQSLTLPGRLRLGLRTGLLLARRGFRPI